MHAVDIHLCQVSVSYKCWVSSPFMLYADIFANAFLRFRCSIFCLFFFFGIRHLLSLLFGIRHLLSLLFGIRHLLCRLLNILVELNYVQLSATVWFSWQGK